MLHVPPLTVLVKVNVMPAQTGMFPPMGPGKLFTVTTTEAEPQAVVYVATAVPAAKPSTVPVALMVATVVGARLHVPPAAELTRVIVPPGQSGELPVIAAGAGLTVTMAVTVPQVVV